MTIYITAGTDRYKTEAYTNKETAEKRAEQMNWNIEMGGGRGQVHIEEIEVKED